MTDQHVLWRRLDQPDHEAAHLSCADSAWRLQLALDQAADVQAAWLRFPSFTLEPLRQVYHRLDEATYRYASAGGSYVAELQVHPNGFVTSYPQLWQLEMGS